MADEISDQHPVAPDDASATAVARKPRVFRADGRKLGAGEVRVAPYDFRNPVFLTETELRRLRARHEDFTRYLGARLSLYLRTEFGVKIQDLGTTTYTRFTGTIGQPAHVCLFKAEPLTGVGLLSITPRLALSIADRLLGGRGLVMNTERALTEIETALLEDIIVIMLEEWCGLWKAAQEVTTSIIGCESSGRFLQTSPRDAAMLVLTMEVTFGDCTEPMQIGVPYYTLEPVLQKLQARSHKEGTPVGGKPRAVAWAAAYDQIAMPVRAEWVALEMTLRQLTQWRVGDLIPMPARVIGETQVLLNGSPKFVGSAGIDGEHLAVQISRPVEPAANPLKKDGNKSA